MNKLFALLLTSSFMHLVGCDQTTPQSMGTVLGESDTQYSQVKPSTQISFPEDHQAHNQYRHEWWYLTANLTDKNGKDIGMQWTQFRFAVAPPKDGTKKSNAWRSQQVYMAHSAVTTAQVHYADEKWSRGQKQLAGVESEPFRVFLDDWQWRSSSTDMFPATLEASSDQFGYQLVLTSDAPYQKQGNQGYSEKSADGSVASHYYSQPFISVEGTVTIDGVTHQVTGDGWIDREWSSQFLLDSQQGWDWFALRLDEDTTMVLFQLRDSKSGKASYNHARIMYRDGHHLDIEPNEMALEPIKNTNVEGRSYPTEWRLAIPSQELQIELSAINSKAKMPLNVAYWEGPVLFKGTHSGKGYMELTGY
ncbi:lipocalin-like domain-containing protein [Vibrio maerlii]|uniref:lipocalin-like domain-containing protein n=1 Tax=Vibrio maerlii TaxID=2231648 RepID=UPI000E3C4180|nr:lipocalin-like domain-containing protein [Vibrio maerlii]